VKVLVDVSAGVAVADAIRSLVPDTAFVRDKDPTLPDDAILSWAVIEQRLVVTMDKDFGELVSGPDYPTRACCYSVSMPPGHKKTPESQPPFSPIMPRNCRAASPFIVTVGCASVNRPNLPFASTVR
jgi:hypothetical protein